VGRQRQEGPGQQGRSPGMEEVVARMRELATNRGDAQRRSRRERAQLRGAFRGLCSAVEACAVSLSTACMSAGRRGLQSCLQASVKASKSPLCMQGWQACPVEGKMALGAMLAAHACSCMMTHA
jgi:hypothetical protein